MPLDSKMPETKHTSNSLLCYSVFVLGECTPSISSEIRNRLTWICPKRFRRGGVDESVFKKVWLRVKNLLKTLKSQSYHKGDLTFRVRHRAARHSSSKICVFAETIGVSRKGILRRKKSAKCAFLMDTYQRRRSQDFL